MFYCPQAHPPMSSRGLSANTKKQVCIYIYMYVYMYIYIYVCMHICYVYRDWLLLKVCIYMYIYIHCSIAPKLIPLYLLPLYLLVQGVSLPILKRRYVYECIYVYIYMYIYMSSSSPPYIFSFKGSLC
jgi:hypothetical protein